MAFYLASKCKVEGSVVRRPDEQRIDADARLILPTSFANSVKEDRIRFVEESVKPLSDVDRDYFLTVLEKSSMPSKALIKAAQL